MKAPSLRDEQIALRPPHEGDLQPLVDACGDPQIARFTRVPDPYTVDDARAFLDGAAEGLANGTHFSLVIADTATGPAYRNDLARPPRSRVAEVGYWVRREDRGRGHASHATRLLAEWALRALGLARVQLHAFPENIASQRVAEKAGSTREGLLRSYRELRGVRRDLVAYSLVSTDLDD